jgi:hypothetical protein
MTIIPEPSIFSTSDWGAEKVNTDFLRLPYRACGVVVHHTDTEGWKRPALDIKIPAQLNIAKTKAFNLARIIQHDHLHIKGWSDSGMHFLVTRDGLICEGRTGSLKAAKEGKFIKGAHAGNNFPNQHCWGIEKGSNGVHLLRVLRLDIGNIFPIIRHDRDRELSDIRRNLDPTLAIC